MTVNCMCFYKWSQLDSEIAMSPLTDELVHTVVPDDNADDTSNGDGEKKVNQLIFVT